MDGIIMESGGGPNSLIIRPCFGEHDLRGTSLSVGDINSSADILYNGAGTVVQDGAGIRVSPGFNDLDQMIFRKLRWTAGHRVKISYIIDIAITAGYPYATVGGPELLSASRDAAQGTYHTVGSVRLFAGTDGYLRGASGALSIGSQTIPAGLTRVEYSDTATPGSSVTIYTGVLASDYWGSGTAIGAPRTLGNYSSATLVPRTRGGEWEAPAFCGPDPVVMLLLEAA